MESLGKKIFEFRSRYRITQEAFSEMSGVSRRTINRVEANKIKLQAETYGKIMEVLNLE